MSECVRKIYGTNTHHLSGCCKSVIMAKMLYEVSIAKTKTYLCFLPYLVLRRVVCSTIRCDVWSQYRCRSRLPCARVAVLSVRPVSLCAFFCCCLTFSKICSTDFSFDCYCCYYCYPFSFIDYKR